MSAVLCASAGSSMPVPRPVTSLAGTPSPAAISAAAGVVLPMPMSPPISRSAPSAISSSATAMPAAMAARVSSGVSASSRWIAPDERLILNRRTCVRTSLGSSASSLSTPMSSTRSCAPC